MNNIKQLIEEEAREHISRLNSCESKEYDDLIIWGYEGDRISFRANDLRDLAFKYGCFAGANFAISHLQHANRWRKVSEELSNIGVKVIIKLPMVITVFQKCIFLKIVMATC